MIIGYEPEKIKCKMITPSGAFHFKGYVRNYDTERKVCDVVAENNIVYSEVPFDRIKRIDEATPLPWEDKYIENMKDCAEVLRGKEYKLCHIDEFDVKDQICNISIDDGIDEVTGNPVITKFNEVPFDIMKRTRVGETTIPFPWERENEDKPSSGTYYHKYDYPYNVEFQLYEGLCSYPCMLIWYDIDANICTVSTRLFNKYFVKLTDVVKMPDGPELPWQNDPRFIKIDKRLGPNIAEYDFYQNKIEKLKDCGDILFYGNWRHCHIDDYDVINRSCAISLSKNPNDDDLKETIQLTDVPFTSIRHIRIYNTTLLLPWEHSEYINGIKYIKNRPKDAYKPKMDLNETLKKAHDYCYGRECADCKFNNTCCIDSSGRIIYMFNDGSYARMEFEKFAKLFVEYINEIYKENIDDTE